MPNCYAPVAPLQHSPASACSSTGGSRWIGTDASAQTGRHVRTVLAGPPPPPPRGAFCSWRRLLDIIVVILVLLVAIERSKDFGTHLPQPLGLSACAVRCLLPSRRVVVGARVRATGVLRLSEAACELQVVCILYRCRRRRRVASLGRLLRSRVPVLRCCAVLLAQLRSPAHTSRCIPTCSGMQCSVHALYAFAKHGASGSSRCVASGGRDGEAGSARACRPRDLAEWLRPACASSWAGSHPAC